MVIHKGIELDAPQAQSTRLVVAIEDDDVLRSVLVDILEEEEYKVVVHGRPEGAQQLVRRLQPAVVLLDLRLGCARATRGWAVLDELVLDPATRDIPVIVISADPSLEAHAPAMYAEQGVWTLPKPFDVTELVDIVDRVASTRSTRREVEPVARTARL